MHDRLKKFESVLEKDLKEELEKIISRNTVSPTDVKTITDAVRLMLKCKEYEEWLNGGESSYDRGRSYRRNYDNSYRGDNYRMSRDYRPERYDEYGHSGHSIKDRTIARLETMFDEADSEHERQQIQDFINRVEMDK